MAIPAVHIAPLGTNAWDASEVAGWLSGGSTKWVDGWHKCMCAWKSTKVDGKGGWWAQNLCTNWWKDRLRPLGPVCMLGPADVQMDGQMDGQSVEWWDRMGSQLWYRCWLWWRVFPNEFPWCKVPFREVGVWFSVVYGMSWWVVWNSL